MPSSALGLGLGLVRTRSFISTLFLASRNLQPSRRSILERLWLPPPPRMMHNHQEEKGKNIEVKSNPRDVDRVQQLLHSTSNSTINAGGWEKCWEEGAIPWDLGQPTPILLNLLRLGSLPTGRALVPGCGSGHDVVAIACPERYVVGLDISDTATNKAIELSSSSPNSDHLTFITEDFFTWHSDELFDLIFDYTFFCAIEPEMRPAWASRIQDLLKEDGELITLMFPISDHVGGPPYKVSVADYKEVLNPLGFKEICIMDNELAVGPRKVWCLFNGIGNDTIPFVSWIFHMRNEVGRALMPSSHFTGIRPDLALR